ncbi:unnamed protein product [Spirodela intermedia]|uniref:Myb/SANT-like domain-containing protein n=1 Tax=Spirodela intermedia TaxID=51605 RepID=A0A7I8J520_SPIIN|nr:unnamed protein product [Spirodela intermedia]CAA6665140.1 unnamed protein product [Spirodela intermedia]
MASTSMEDSRGEQPDASTDKPDGQHAVAAIMKQVRSLKRRLQNPDDLLPKYQLLEHENQMLLSRMTGCRQCCKRISVDFLLIMFPDGTEGQALLQCKANWTDEYKKAFIDICLDEVHKGNRPTKRFNDLNGTKYVKGQFKNLYAVMRDSWREWKSLVNRTNGWGWDPVLQTIDCDPQTWEEYCKSHKQAKQFLTRPLLYEDDLDELFKGTAAADGETYCSSEPDVDGAPVKLLPVADQFEGSYSMETFEPSDARPENEEVLSEEPSRSQTRRHSPPDAHWRRRKKFRAANGAQAQVTAPSAADVIRLLDHIEDVEMGGNLYLGEFFVALDPRVRSAWLRSVVYGHKGG